LVDAGGLVPELGVEAVATGRSTGAQFGGLGGAAEQIGELSEGFAVGDIKAVEADVVEVEQMAFFAGRSGWI